MVIDHRAWAPRSFMSPCQQRTLPFEMPRIWAQRPAASEASVQSLKLLLLQRPFFLKVPYIVSPLSKWLLSWGLDWGLFPAPLSCYSPSWIWSTLKALLPSWFKSCISKGAIRGKQFPLVLQGKGNGFSLQSPMDAINLWRFLIQNQMVGLSTFLSPSSWEPFRWRCCADHRAKGLFPRVQPP